MLSFLSSFFVLHTNNYQRTFKDIYVLQLRSLVSAGFRSSLGLRLFLLFVAHFHLPLIVGARSAAQRMVAQANDLGPG